MSPRPLRLTNGLVLFPAVALAVLAGCGGSTPEQKAIVEASASMQALGYSGSTPLPAVEARRSQYQKLIAALKPAVDSKNAGEAAAASGLMARAQAGLAEIAAASAADAENQALAEVSNIRAAFDQWVIQKSLAEMLRAYDPTAELAKLDEQIRQREAEAARAAEAKQRQVSVVEQIRAKAKQARDQVAGFREQESSIRASAANGTQTQRAAALEQAMAVKRRGDEYEKQAGGFEAEAASEAPEVDTLQSTIDKLNRQVQLFRDSKQGMISRGEANKRQAASAQAEADETAAHVTKLLDKLDKARVEITKPTDEAARLYGLATSAAKKSAGSTPGGKGAANLAAGSIYQSRGDLLANKARGLGTYAGLARSLNKGGQPAMSADKVSQSRKAYEDGVLAAEDSYKSAIQMFESSVGGASAEIKAKIERVTAAMKRLVGVEEPPPAAPEAPPTDAAPAAGAAMGDKPVEKAADAPAFDAAAVTAEVKAALTQLHTEVAAAPDSPETLSKWVHAADPEVRAFVDVAMDVNRQRLALDGACKAKYGKDLGALIAESKSASIKANPMFGMLGQMSGQVGKQLGALDPATAKITPTSADAATVSVESSPTPFALVKADGGWKLSLDGLFSGDSSKAMITMGKGLMGGISKAFGGVAGKIGSGGYSDAETMLLDLNAQLLAAMPKMAPGGKGGGGGGG